MGIRTRRAHEHSKTHIVLFSLAGLLGFFALGGVVLAFSLTNMVSNWLEDLPDYQNADAYTVAEPTRVYDINGTEIVDYYLQNRRSVGYDQISSYVIQGTVDTEDRRFYTHNGVDTQGIMRAVYMQVLGRSEGASTITQQLVRNTVLSDEQFEQSLRRKIREAYIAIQMEKKYTKEQILLMYLNTINYGHSAYGIEAAAITYFNKHANDLTLAEAATLVGLPQSPSYLDPINNPEAAKARRNLVLDRMYTEGHITEAERDAAQAEELIINQGEVSDPIGDYPYFTDYVRSLLLEDFDSDTILQGGLKVYTTIDPAYQAAAEAAVWNRLDELGNERLEGALVAIEVDTGYIRAMVGGRDYSVLQYNLATQARRQCGSTFKVFTLVAALQEGMNPTVMLNCSSPMQITPTWKVSNISNANYGMQTLQGATAVSSNTGYAQVAEAIGADKTVAAAHAMGIDDDLPAYLSVTLGSVGVPPVQMAEAFATLASGGLHRDAVAITRIEDRNGNVIYQHEDNPTQAISPAVAQAANEILTTVITQGTGSTAGTTANINQPIAGKTGTTDDWEDLWFVGYTPQLSVAVWTGYADVRERVTIWGSTGNNTQTSQPIFGAFVHAVLADTPRAEFPTTDETITYKANTYWNFVGTNAISNDPVAQQKAREEEARRKQEEENRKKAEEEQKKAEEEAQKAAEEEAARKAAEEEAQRQAEEAARRAEEERKAAEAAAAAEAERQRQAEEAAQQSQGDSGGDG